MYQLVQAWLHMCTQKYVNMMALTYSGRDKMAAILHIYSN